MQHSHSKLECEMLNFVCRSWHLAAFYTNLSVTEKDVDVIKQANSSIYTWQYPARLETIQVAQGIFVKGHSMWAAYETENAFV